MTLAERIDALADLDLAKKVFLVFAAVSIFLIPFDALFIYLGRVKAAPFRATSQSRPVKKLEARETYLANFDKSALFGSASAGIGTPALQASLAELAKDYRLQGVILSDDSEAIIQDARTQKTIFVKKGGQLGELTVQEIEEGRVTLVYLGQETKLEIK